MRKKELRAVYRQKRTAIPEAERHRMNDLLLIHFQQLSFPPEASVIMSYWPLEAHAEVNTFLMTDYLQFRMPGLQVAYPVADFANKSLEVMITDDDTSYRKNTYGIAEPMDGIPIEPAEIDIILVPLLVFDQNGFRVGYGKGFYDRFLPACRKDSIKIGFSYFEPLEAINDIDQFDVPLTTGITPGHIYEF